MRQGQGILSITRGLMKLQEKYLEGLRKSYMLSLIEITIITFLHNNPTFDTASEIAEMRMLQKGNVSKGVESLIQKALLRRTPDPQDRRRIHLSLTQAAAPIVQEIEIVQQKLFTQVFTGFSSEETALYTQLNDRIYRNILTGLERM